jgi:hypothetical protein
MPAHANYFHPNMTFGIAMAGFSTSINIFNYYNSVMMGAITDDLAAIAEVAFYDFCGKKRFMHRERLEPYGSLHLDLRTCLIRSNCTAETYGTLLCRLIPEVLPPDFSGKPISSEFIVELSSPSGAKSFVHNVGCPVYGPNRETMASDQVFSDEYACSRYLIFMNNYYGPKIPFLSHGRAFVKITNHRGENISSWSRKIPAQGTHLFSFKEHFPQLQEFLDGRVGTIYIETYNLVRKPLVWVTSPDSDDTIAIDHF